MPIPGFAFVDEQTLLQIHGPRVPLPLAQAEPLNRITFQDLRTFETMEMMLNPERLTYNLETAHRKHQVLGLSHEPVEYQRTKSRKIGPLNLFVSVLVLMSRGLKQTLAIDKVQDILAFMESLYFASELKGEALTRDPIARFTWPGMIDVDVVFDNLRVDVTQFSTGRVPKILAAKMTVEMTEKLQTKGFAEQFRSAKPWMSHRGIGVQAEISFTVPGPRSGGRSPN